MHKVILHNRGNNETYRKNEDSENDSYTFKYKQVAGSDTDQYTKTN